MFITLYCIFSLLINNQDSIPVKTNEYTGFKNAVSVTTDGKGFIYVLDNEANEILKFDTDLNPIKRAGKEGWNSGEFLKPAYIDGSSGLDVYVSDGNNYRVQRFDLNLGFISSLNTSSEIYESTYRFRKPLASLVVNASNLYVIDGDNKRVVVYSIDNPQVTPVRSFGSFNEIDGAMTDPVKIQKDGDNFVYIFDKTKNAVLIYESFGNFQKALKPGKIISIYVYKGDLYILTEERIFIYNHTYKSYTGGIMLNSVITKGVNDLLIYNKEKMYFLKQDKIELYSIK